MSAQDDVTSFSVAHLPIVKKYAQRMGLVEKIDSALNLRHRHQPRQDSSGPYHEYFVWKVADLPGRGVFQDARCHSFSGMA
jgi:hypothetical protein